MADTKFNDEGILKYGPMGYVNSPVRIQFGGFGGLFCEPMSQRVKFGWSQPFVFGVPTEYTTQEQVDAAFGTGITETLPSEYPREITTFNGYSKQSGLMINSLKEQGGTDKFYRFNKYKVGGLDIREDPIPLDDYELAEGEVAKKIYDPIVGDKFIEYKGEEGKRLILSFFGGPYNITQRSPAPLLLNGRGTEEDKAQGRIYGQGAVVIAGSGVYCPGNSETVFCGDEEAKVQFTYISNNSKTGVFGANLYCGGVPLFTDYITSHNISERTRVDRNLLTGTNFGFKKLGTRYWILFSTKTWGKAFETVPTVDGGIVSGPKFYCTKVQLKAIECEFTSKNFIRLKNPDTVYVLYELDVYSDDVPKLYIYPTGPFPEHYKITTIIGSTVAPIPVYPFNFLPDMLDWEFNKDCTKVAGRFPKFSTAGTFREEHRIGLSRYITYYRYIEPVYTLYELSITGGEDGIPEASVIRTEPGFIALNKPQGSRVYREISDLIVSIAYDVDGNLQVFKEENSETFSFKKAPSEQHGGDIVASIDQTYSADLTVNGNSIISNSVEIHHADLNTRLDAHGSAFYDLSYIAAANLELNIFIIGRFTITTSYAYRTSRNMSYTWEESLVENGSSKVLWSYESSQDLFNLDDAEKVDISSIYRYFFNYLKTGYEVLYVPFAYPDLSPLATEFSIRNKPGESVIVLNYSSFNPFTGENYTYVYPNDLLERISPNEPLVSLGRIGRI